VDGGEAENAETCGQWTSTFVAMARRKEAGFDIDSTSTSTWTRLRLPHRGRRTRSPAMADKLTQRRTGKQKAAANVPVQAAADDQQLEKQLSPAEKASCNLCVFAFAVPDMDTTHFLAVQGCAGHTRVQGLCRNGACFPAFGCAAVLQDRSSVWCRVRVSIGYPHASTGAHEETHTALTRSILESSHHTTSGESSSSTCIRLWQSSSLLLPAGLRATTAISSSKTSQTTMSQITSPTSLFARIPLSSALSLPSSSTPS
jgi:hypothetical protein